MDEEEKRRALEEKEAQEAQLREEELNNDAQPQGLDEHSMDIGDEVGDGEDNNKNKKSNNKNKFNNDKNKNDKTDASTKPGNQNNSNQNSPSGNNPRNAASANGNDLGGSTPTIADLAKDSAKEGAGVDSGNRLFGSGDIADKEKGDGSKDTKQNSDDNYPQRDNRYNRGNNNTPHGNDSMPQGNTSGGGEDGGSGAALNVARRGAEKTAQEGVAEGAKETVKAGAEEGVKYVARKALTALLASPIGWIIIGAIIVLVFLIGITGFFQMQPQFLWNRMKELQTNFSVRQHIQGYLVGMDEALTTNEDVIYIAQYLHDMGDEYDLVGWGFAESVKIAGEVDEKGNPVPVEDGQKKGEILEIDAPYLRAYLVAENRTYLVNNYTFNWKSFVNNMFDAEHWGTGLINLHNNLIDTLRMPFTLGSGSVEQLVRGVRVDRATNTMTIRRPNIELNIFDSHFDETTFSLEGWSGRYGKPFELLFTLHLATGAPDLVEQFANHKDLDAKVNIKMKKTDFNGKVYVDGKSIDELEQEQTTDENGNTVPIYSPETIAALRNLENGRASEIKTAMPYISSVTHHWFRNVYFEGTASDGASGSTEVGVDKDEDGIDDYNEETGPKTQVTRKLSADDNTYSFGKSGAEMDYTGDPIPGVSGKITFRGTILNGVSQSKDGVRGVTNPTTKKLFGEKYYIFDGTVSKAKEIQKARKAGDDSLKEYIDFQHGSINAFGILEASETLDGQFIYRDLKELVIELGYFEREDFEKIEKEVLEWPLPDFKRKGWPDTKYEKQILEYGTLMLCEESVQKIKDQENEIAEKESEEMTAREGEEDEGSSGSSGGGSGEGESKSKEPCFSAHTQSVIESERGKISHNSSFYKNTLFRNQENYDEYIKSLGGVFETYGGRDNIANVTTAEELQDVSEYVFGLMSIWGFNYDKGKPEAYKHWGKSNSSIAQYDFYRGTEKANDGHCAHPVESIDGRCLGESNKYGYELNATTNCNHTVDAVFFKAGIFSKEDTSKPKSSCSISDLFGHGAQEVPSIQDLQPGDIIECYRDKAGNQADHNTWPDGESWFHACFIGERDDMAGTLTIYEGGGYFTNSGNYKHVVKLDGSDWPYPGWGGVRVTNITNSGLVGFPEDIDVVAMGDGVVKGLLDENTNMFTLSTLSRRLDGTDAESPEVFYEASEQTLEGIEIKLSGHTELKGYTIIVYGFDVDDKIKVGDKVKAGDTIGKTIKSNMCFILLDRDRAVVEDMEDYVKKPAVQEEEEGQLYPGNNAEEKVWNALIQAGYSPTAAAAAMGNIYGESGFRTDAVEHGSGIGFGLCQWSYERRTRLEQYAKSKGKPPSDVDLQVEYLMAELKPGGGCSGYAKYQFGGHEG